MTARIIIYLVTNILNGKKYVGITTQGLNTRRTQHLNCAATRRTNSLLHKAFRRYGKDNFTFEHIATAIDWDAACEAEKLLIKQYNSFKPGGYNLTLGGEGLLGGHHTHATKEKMSKTRTGKKLSESHRSRISEGRIGIKISLQARAEMSDRRKGVKLSLEHRANMTEGKKKYYAALREQNGGSCYSKERLERMSAWQKGVPKPELRGRKRSEETRRKLSEALTGRKLSKEHVEKMRLSRFGKKASEVTRARMSETQKVRHTGRKEVICLQDSKKFPSINEAAQHYNVTPKGISKVLCGGAKTTHGLTFSYLNQQRSA